MMENYCRAMWWAINSLRTFHIFNRYEKTIGTGGVWMSKWIPIHKPTHAMKYKAEAWTISQISNLKIEQSAWLHLFVALMPVTKTIITRLAYMKYVNHRLRAYILSQFDDVSVGWGINYTNFRFHTKVHSTKSS